MASDEQIAEMQGYLDQINKQKKQPELEAETPKEDTEKPKQLLEGRAEFTEPMKRTAEAVTKYLFPQPEDSPVQSFAKTTALPANTLMQGISEVPETIGNFALGAGESAANVPQENRVTIGDLLRKINPGIVTPTEYGRSPAYQQQQAAAGPVMGPAVGATRFIGNLMGPVPGAGLVGRAVPEFIKRIPEMQALAKILAPRLEGLAIKTGAAGPVATAGLRSTPIPQNLNPAQIMNILKYNPIKQAARQGARAGAAYAPMFYGGEQFGQNRTFPNTAQLAGSAAGGALFGAGVGIPIGALQRLAASRQLAGAIAKSQLPELPKSATKAAASTQDLLPAPILKERVGATLDKAAAKYPMQPGRIEKVGNRYLNILGKRYEDESDDHILALERGRRQVASDVRSATETAEKRGYSREQADKRMALADQKKQQAVGQTAAQTGTSGGKFEELSARIKSAQSPEELEAMRNEIFNAGPGPKGSRLIDGGQQKELDRQWREARYNKFKEQGGEPGESKGAAQGTPKAPEKEVPKGKESPTKKFIVGAFRKIVNKKTYGPRKNRYQFAVSVDALADAAELPQAERTALKQWVGDLSEARRELTYKNKQIERLAEWALKNEGEWIGSQNKVKLTRTTDKATETSQIDVLTHEAKEGEFKRILLRAKMEMGYEDKVEHNLEKVRVNLERYGGEGTALKTAKSHVRTTTNGIVPEGGAHTNMDGSLSIKGIQDLKLPEFKPPKSADELFNQMHELLQWKEYFEGKMTDIRGAVAYPNISYDHLGDGRTVADVMQGVFDKLAIPHLNGKAPNTHVWHIDNTGHVSTVEFVQGAMHGSLDEAVAENERLVKDIEEGKITYDALWGRPGMMARLFGYVPGAELPILGAIFGKPIGKFASKVGRATGIEAIFSGTIDDILRDHARFDGDSVSQLLHQMNGEISSNFFHDTSGKWHPIKSAEDLADTLNEFKGAKLSRGDYRRRALEVLDQNAQKTDTPIIQQDVEEAYRKADTALMIRKHQEELAKQVKLRIEEMEIRKKDAENGRASREGKKLYTPEDYDAEGYVRKSAYSSLYHDALIELHNGLTLQPSKYGRLGGFLDSAAARKSTSIMANNPRVALKNFFDQAPLTLAYFGRHFLTAVQDMHAMPEVQEAIERMPVIPQADMSAVQLEESLKDPRKSEDLGEAGVKFWKQANLFLSKKLDPIFQGSTTLVSLADRNYAKYSALASLNKQAALRGIDRHEFLQGLMNGSFTKSEEKEIFGQMSRDLTQTLNSARPDLNKDLFASSTLGKLTQQYSTPGRRAMKLQEGWLRSDKVEDKLKLAGSAFGLVALGGSGAIPMSMQSAYRLYGAMVGQSEEAEKNIQWLDQWNMLRNYAGIDYSTNFGPDYFTGAMPTLEAMEKAVPQAMSLAKQAKSEPEAWLKIGAGTLLEGLTLIPKIGPVGWDEWKSLLKGVDAAGNGTRKVYFNYNGSLRSISIPYGYNDAMRDFLIGGINPKAYPLIQQAKMNAAKKFDAESNFRKNILPEKQDATYKEN